MRLAILSFLLLLAAKTLSADTSKVIIAGAFNMPEHAQQRVDKLKMYLSYEQDAYALQKAGHFTYEVRRSGPYYLCVLHHFRDFGEVLTVIDSIKKIYPDAYIKNNMNFTQPYDAAAAATEVTQAAMQPSDTQRLSDDQGAVIPAAEESVTVEQAVKPLPEAKPFAAEKTTHPLSETATSLLPLLLMAAALLGGAGLLLFFVRRRKQAKQPLLMIPDMTEYEPNENETHPAAPAEQEASETSPAENTDMDGSVAPEKADISVAKESDDPETAREESPEAEEAKAESSKTQAGETTDTEVDKTSDVILP